MGSWAWVHGCMVHGCMGGSGFAEPNGMTTTPSYTSLVAWQRADDLFIRLHRLATKCFPVEERFELSAQLRRAALSVPTNIVEGTARYHRRETLHFLRIAWGSLQEVGYFVHVAKRLKYISQASADELMTEIRQTAAPLSGLIGSFEGARGPTSKAAR
jgi:four helix bundle protein